MAKVYLWFGGNLSDSFIDNIDSVGHAALQYGSKPSEYISFWPATTEEGDGNTKIQKTKIEIFEPRKSLFVESYEKECLEDSPGRPADLTIELNNINKAIVEGFLFRFKSGEDSSFNLYNQNCSSVVANALIVGYRLENKLTGNWFRDGILDLNQGMLSLATVVGYLEDQLVRFAGIRSLQEFYVKVIEQSVSIYPKSFRRTYLYTYVKRQSSIWWSPYHIAFLAFLLKKELN